MKLWQYTTSVILGVACAVLSAVIIFTSQRNMTLQETIQNHQQQLNNGVLGEQTQQVANNILQDMAATAASNEKMRSLLSKYGYNIPSASTPKPTPVKSEEEK